MTDALTATPAIPVLARAHDEEDEERERAVPSSTEIRTMEGGGQETDKQQNASQAAGRAVKVDEGESGGGEGNEGNQTFCRVCFEEEGLQEGENLLDPCACNGTSRFIHAGCLQQWRSENKGKNATECATCRYVYRFHYASRRNGWKGWFLEHCSLDSARNQLIFAVVLPIIFASIGFILIRAGDGVCPQGFFKAPSLLGKAACLFSRYSTALSYASSRGAYYVCGRLPPLFERSCEFVLLACCTIHFLRHLVDIPYSWYEHFSSARRGRRKGLLEKIRLFSQSLMFITLSSPGVLQWHLAMSSTSDRISAWANISWAVLSAGTAVVEDVTRCFNRWKKNIKLEVAPYKGLWGSQRHH